MRRWLEGLETFAIDVILNRRYGRRADILRWIIHALSQIYRLIVQARLAIFRHRIYRPRTLGCLVISVGNLTVGGTGKTPVVEMLARDLHAGERKLASLSRGSPFTGSEFIASGHSAVRWSAWETSPSAARARPPSSSCWLGSLPPAAARLRSCLVDTRVFLNHLLVEY